MNSQEFAHLFDKHSVLIELEDELLAGKTRIGIQNCIGSSKAIVLSQLLKSSNRSQLIICDDLEHAENIYSDIEVFMDHNYVFLWKDSFLKSFNLTQSDNAKIQSNASVLDALSDIDHPKIVVTYPEAISEKIINQDQLKKSKLIFRVGEEVDLDFLIELLNEYHFYREDFVYEPGQFSIRGGIIDLFSYANELPIRLELFGRTIESIREFDPISQLSTKTLVRGTVVPNVSESVQTQEGTHILNYLGKKTIVCTTDLPKAINKIEKGLEKVSSQANEEHNPTNIFFKLPEIINQIGSNSIIEFGSQYHFRPSIKLKFNQAPQAPINKNFNLLIDTFKSLEEQGYKPVIFSESPKQIERLESIFDDLNSGYQLQPVYKSLSEGFIDHSLKVAAYTEHQIFNRYYLARSGKSVSTSGNISLKELQNLNPGDFVVHIDLGIGQFKGLQRIEMAGKMQDAIRIEYRNNDLLYVNIASLYKISKYKGNSGNPPKINKLGGDAWTNLKRKTKAQVKDIAKDLIKLYAKRKVEKGFKFHPDTYLQTELEASFI